LIQINFPASRRPGLTSWESLAPALDATEAACSIRRWFWCFPVKACIAVDENESLCGKMQSCNVAACPKADLFAAVASAAREAPGERLTCKQ